MICFVFDAICINDNLSIVLRGIKSILPISYWSWLIIFPFRDSTSRLNPYISDIRRICGGMTVNSEVLYVLFQGWAICYNDIISLVMSLKIVYARKGRFLWRMDFNFTWWKHIVVKQHIVKWFVLDEMEVYLGGRFSKNWRICLLQSSFSISYSSVKSKYGGKLQIPF